MVRQLSDGYLIVDCCGDRMTYFAVNTSADSGLANDPFRAVRARLSPANCTAFFSDHALERQIYFGTCSPFNGRLINALGDLDFPYI